MESYAQLIACVTFHLVMIFRQQLFRISNAVSVQGEFFAIAHDDFAEAQLLHIPAVENCLYGRSEERGMILYLRKQIDGGGADLYFAAVFQGDDDIPAFFLGVENIRFGDVDGIFVLTKLYERNRLGHNIQGMVNTLFQFRYFDGLVQKNNIVRIGLFSVIDPGTAHDDGCVHTLGDQCICHFRAGDAFRQADINIESIVLHGIGKQCFGIAERIGINNTCGCGTFIGFPF